MCLNGILGVAPQRLNNDVLLDPLEKDFYIPSMTIDIGDVQCTYLKVIGNKVNYLTAFVIDSPYKPHVGKVIN